MTILFFIAWFIAGIFTIWFARKFAELPLFNGDEVRIGEVLTSIVPIILWPIILMLSLIFIFLDSEMINFVIYHKKGSKK
jgi:hypothetical protein